MKTLPTLEECLKVHLTALRHLVLFSGDVSESNGFLIGLFIVKQLRRRHRNCLFLGPIISILFVERIIRTTCTH